jgi:hypothetical protein
MPDPTALVVLDGLDEIPGENQHRTVSHILNFKRVRTLLVTSRSGARLRGGRTLELNTLPRDDAQRLITGLSQLEPESIEKILGLARGYACSRYPHVAVAHFLKEELRTWRGLADNYFLAATSESVG